jgi:two-component system chemotaxis response regulator CheB
MRRIRVLIVDDSVVLRRILKDALSEDPQLEVVGTAANGRIALNMVEQFTPDIVTLDIEMPDVDGLQVLRALQESRPKLPVIMFSTLTERGAVATLDALALGARDYVTKPSQGNMEGSTLRIRTELIPKIKTLCGWESALDLLVPARTRGGFCNNASGLPRAAVPIEVVALGTSTGGPNALTEVLPQIPKNFPVPVIVVQHMPPTFTRFLAERLNAVSQLKVLEAGDDQILRSGTAWIAPGDFHVAVENEGTEVHLRTFRTPPENSCRPAVDVLFRSLARTFGNRALAVVMTGMGQDGLRGCEQLHEVGATILAQDENTSVVWGMPGFVANAGLATKTLPLPQIAGEIVRRVMNSQLLASRERPAHVDQSR